MEEAGCPHPPRRAASLLGAAALGVTAITGAGWAAGSAAGASVPRPSFSKLSLSQVKARLSGKRERMVVVFDNQLSSLPANRSQPILVREIACDHMSYFTTEEGLRALAEVLPR